MDVEWHFFFFLVFGVCLFLGMEPRLRWSPFEASLRFQLRTLRHMATWLMMRSVEEINLEIAQPTRVMVIETLKETGQELTNCTEY